MKQTNRQQEQRRILNLNRSNNVMNKVLHFAAPNTFCLISQKHSLVGAEPVTQRRTKSEKKKKASVPMKGLKPATTPHPWTHSSPLPSPQHSPIPDLAAGGRAEGEAMGLPPRPGEDNRLRPGKWASDLDSMASEIGVQRKKKKKEPASSQSQGRRLTASEKKKKKKRSHP